MDDSVSAAQGLAVLSSIFLILFALWADYYARFLNQPKSASENDNEDGLEEKDLHTLHLGRIRAASVIVTLFQVTLYLGASQARQDYPGYAGGFFCFILVAQGIIQANLERKVRKPLTPAESAADSKEQLKFLFKNLTWFGASAALYVAVLCSCVFTSAFVAQYLFNRGLPSAAGLGILVVGVLVGVAGGLAANFIAAPYFMRKIFTCSDQGADYSALKKQVQRGFLHVNHKPPRVAIIEGAPGRTAQAFICGWAFGKGPFRSTLFVSRQVIENLTPMEIDAIVRHETSHIALGHFKRRLSVSIKSVLFSSTIATVLFLAGTYFFRDTPVVAFLAPMMALGAFLMTCQSIQSQNHLHELEADIFCIEAYSGDLDHLASALRKLDHLNDLSSHRKDPRNFLVGTGHPTTEFRIRALKAYFERQKAAVTSTETSSSDDDFDQQDRAA